MRFQAFADLAQRVFDEIPDPFRDGVDGLVVERRALTHPDLPGIFTLGECVTEDYPSDWAGPETTRSLVVLYYGSFRAVARQDGDFDWAEEIWETLTHEIRHHLESLAGTDDLEGVDYAMDQSFRREQGMEYDPLYYRHGEPMADGTFVVEYDHYIEREAPDGSGGTVDIDWAGCRYRVDVEPAPADVHLVELDGLVEPPERVFLVLRSKKGLGARIRRALAGGGQRVFESIAHPQPSDGP